MNMNEIMERLNEVFRDVFDDKRLVVDEYTTADDIEDLSILTSLQQWSRSSK